MVVVLVVWENDDLLGKNAFGNGIGFDIVRFEIIRND